MARGSHPACWLGVPAWEGCWEGCWLPLRLLHRLGVSSLCVPMLRPAPRSWLGVGVGEGVGVELGLGLGLGLAPWPNPNPNLQQVRRTVRRRPHRLRGQRDAAVDVAMVSSDAPG